MSFTHRPSIRLDFRTPVVFEAVEVDENTGCVVTKPVDMAAGKLPPADLFRLDRLLKSGKNLKQMNTKIMNSFSIDLSEPPTGIPGPGEVGPAGDYAHIDPNAPINNSKGE